MSGTHGTGIKYGNMATLVAEIEIISAQGIMYRASERENHDIFKATLVGLGILGVITEVTLHCVPAFNLHEVITVIPLEECLNNLNHLIHRSDHVKLWFEFHTRMVQVYSTNKTTLPRRDVPSSFILNMQFTIFEYIQYFISWFPSITPITMSALVGPCNALRTGDSIGLPMEVFNVPHYLPPHPELEYAIPLNATVNAILELIAIQEELKHEISFNLITEIRFVKGDDVWLSPAYGQDSTFITVAVYNPPETSLRHYFRQFEDVAIKYGGRPHWGKIFYKTETELRTQYPKWDEFMALRKKMDPNQLFKNSFIRRLFHLPPTS
jgi:L-gulonolactone oxidase